MCRRTISTLPSAKSVISHGFAIPVIILIAVGIVMTFLTSRTRFGRYVFAIGGNPEAAELAGINTKMGDRENLCADGVSLRAFRRHRQRKTELGNQQSWNTR